MDQVILVDEHDNELGTIEKMEAHRNGTLHRAFSVLIFNSKGDLLIQQRAKTKYHSGGLWTNTCCSHPRPGELIVDAAHRRLKEEMGIEVVLNFSHKFIYKIELENGLTEYELDYVFTGIFDGKPNTNPSEVADWKYISKEYIQKEIASYPNNFTHWFKIILKEWETMASEI
jgi:isopentenyl-diphosphate Delta-isomerase